MSNSVRLTPHRLGASAIIVLLGIGAIAAISGLMAPSDTALLQASVSARDYAATRLHMRNGDENAPGAFALMMRALIGAGRPGAALAEVDRRIAIAPADPALRRLRARLLAALGRTRDEQAELVDIARRSHHATDIRALATIAAARGDRAVERVALRALANGGRTTDAEIERLAALDAGAGDAAAAWRRLAVLEASGHAMSEPAVAQLVALAVARASAEDLASLLARLHAAGHHVPAPAALIDAIAVRRPVVALAVAEAMATRDPWVLVERRIGLLAATGRRAAALGVFDRLTTAPTGTIEPEAIVRMAYDLNAVPALYRVLVAGRLAPIAPPLAVDLARRAVAAGKPGLIAAIDAAAGRDWRRLDPWLALQLARAAGDSAGVRRWAALQPAGTAAGIEEAMARSAGDRAALRRILLADPRDPAATAERLLANGFPADAEAVLRRAAAAAPPDDRMVARLLYLWGPRPHLDALDWIAARARASRNSASRLAWLRLYADRAPPSAALAALADDAARDTTALLLVRLTIAEGAGRQADAAAILDRLLDGRPLAVPELRRVVALLPAEARARRLAIYARLAEAGSATAQMRCDLAWSALAARRLVEARGHIVAALAFEPDDATTLTLAGDIAQASGDVADARRRLAAALAATPVSAKTLVARATLIDRLGRPGEALALVRVARADSPADVTLRTLEARLLVATGHPAAATSLLAAAR